MNMYSISRKADMQGKDAMEEKQAGSTTLAESLSSFGNTLNPEEQSALRKVLAVAIPELIPNNGSLPSELDAAVKFATVCECLRSLQPFSRRIPENGIVFHGRPSWLTDTLLSKLQIEAEETRPSAIVQHGHFLGKGGLLADQLAFDEGVLQWVIRYAGTSKPTGIASYIHYEQEGDGLYPHVDTDIFAINVLVMLKHVYPSHGPVSETCVYPNGNRVEKYDLKPGETIMMFGGSVVHARLPLQKGEMVRIVTFGFQPM